MKDIVLITGGLICGTLLGAIIFYKVVFVIQMKEIDRLAESPEESLKRYENNIFVRIGRAIAGALFGPDSHSAGRYEWVTAQDTRIKKDNTVAGEKIEIGAPVSIIGNPNRKRWQFWKPKLIAVNFHPNCRCNIMPVEEPADD